MNRIFSIALTSAILLSMSGVTAMAKPTEPEPEGIQAGGFVMHPGGDLALAYDSQSNHGNNDGLIDLGVHFKTRLADETTRSWNNAFNLKWRQYWGAGDADPNGGVDVRLSSSADLFKQKLFRLTPSLSYDYLSEPEDDNLRQDFKNHTIRAGLGAIIQPGEGAIFSEKLSYSFHGRLYSEHSDISNFAHRIESVTRWNFLPNTSMSLTANVTITHFLEDTRNASVGSDTTSGGENSTSYPFRIKYSLQGLLLARLSYSLGLGYAYVYYTNNNKEHMFIMNARAAYSFRDNIELALEYRKDFDNALFGDYYKLHRVALTFDALWIDKIQTKAEVGFGAFDFRSNVDLSRKDYQVTGKADVYYYFFPGLKLGLEYRISYNDSDYKSASYTKHMLTLNAAYDY